ncbi:hypothetical protein WJX82_002778 [Trebouxia sp. C0006]
MLVERVPDAEFFAVEQAILAAERQRGAALHASSAAKSGSQCLASSAHPLNRCSVDAKAFAVDSKKRKLPLSFAQQEKRPAPAATAALDYKGHTIYAYTAVEVDYHCTQLLKDPPSTVGFDIEWRVTYKAGQAPRKTALLQLCSRRQHGQYQCLLLHIAHSGLTPALVQILESEEMKKIGVGISGDAHKLHRDFGVQCVGLVCLSEEANVRLCSSANGRMPQKWSLAGLMQELLHLTLDKGIDIRCSNWETCPLSSEQKAYAATDAYAAVKLYQVLQGMPIIAAPPRAVETAPAPVPGPASSAEVAVAELIVPSQAVLLPLQPSKLTVYRLFAEQGVSMDSIASQRALQLGTVQSYIAEAMAAGYGYPWHRMGAPYHLLTVAKDLKLAAAGCSLVSVIAFCM